MRLAVCCFVAAFDEGPHLDRYTISNQGLTAARYDAERQLAAWSYICASPSFGIGKRFGVSFRRLPCQHLSVNVVETYLVSPHACVLSHDIAEHAFSLFKCNDA